MRHYKSLYGIDLAYEIQQSLKRLWPSSLCLNENLNGYMILADAKEHKLKIDLTNKISYLSNGKSLTGYHTLRQRNLS
jgi:hypothetical protein